MYIREATVEDIALIFSFIQKKAAFDRSIGAFSGELGVSEDKLRKTLFGAVPLSYVLFAESAGCAIGYALYGFRYSSFAGQPSIWLDDLYVDEGMRSQGAGEVLMRQLATLAKQHDCTHLAWNADARNIRGLRFYHRLGARITYQHDMSCFLTWIPEDIANNR